MRIGELAAQLGLNPKTIRYYEDIGLLPEPERTPSGYRVYGDADVERLTFIKTAQRLGMALDEVGEILALRDRGEQLCGYVRAVLRRQVADIDRRMAELATLRQQLVALDEAADRLPDAGPGRCRLIDHVRQPETSA
jgi:DNA-binding transcriptional MerR regulator